MCSFRYKEILTVIHAKSLHRLAFPFKRYRVQHHAIADQVDGIFVKDARRYLVKNDLFILHVQCMARIGAALEAGNDIVPGSKVIYYLSFSLIAPLKT